MTPSSSSPTDVPHPPSADHSDNVGTSLDDQTPPGRRGPVAAVVRWLFLGLAGASFLIWIYAFSGQARRDPPDLLDHASYTTEAEAICEQARQSVEVVPDATSADSPEERAEQVAVTTAVLEQMVDDLEELAGATELSERDEVILAGWIGDWRVMIGDRYRYIDQLATDPFSPFRVTDTGIGERLDRRITRMAETNGMHSCADPGDAG